MRSKSSETIDYRQIIPVTNITEYYKKAKKNEPNEWILAIVVKED